MVVFVAEVVLMEPGVDVDMVVKVNLGSCC
jgi:hypothetical protein